MGGERRCKVSRRQHQIALLEAGSWDRRALKTHKKITRAGQRGPTRAAGSKQALRESGPPSPSPRCLEPQLLSKVPKGVPGRSTFAARAPSPGRQRAGPCARAPACLLRGSPPWPTGGPSAPLLASTRPVPLSHTGRKRPRPLRSGEGALCAPCPGRSSPTPRLRGTSSPRGVRTTRKKAWAPWCRRHRRLPLSPAYHRPGKQRRAGTQAASRAPAAAVATSTGGWGSAHPQARDGRGAARIRLRR